MRGGGPRWRGGVSSSRSRPAHAGGRGAPRQQVPTVVVIDPWADAPKGRTIPSLATTDERKDTRAAVERATLEAARAGHQPGERPAGEPAER